MHHIAAWGKPMIISTGMNDLTSVRKTVEIVQSYGTPLALMHTTNLYPTPDHLVRLGAMQQMMQEFPGIPIGLSDHTLGNEACLAAVALGASLLERHFTDHMQRTGPDIVCSMDEQACANLILQSRRIHSMLGGVKTAALEEQVTIDFAFATLVTIKSVKKGELFTHENLWVKRPGTGPILAEHYQSVIGKTANTDIDHDTHIDWHHIA
jgi:N-acetylneuraminate synthase